MLSLRVLLHVLRFLSSSLVGGAGFLPLLYQKVVCLTTYHAVVHFSTCSLVRNRLRRKENNLSTGASSRYTVKDIETARLSHFSLCLYEWKESKNIYGPLIPTKQANNKTMSSPSTVHKRQRQDVMKLMMSDYDVCIPNEAAMHDFCVKFKGPAGTPYEGGVWKVHVCLPREYPFKSPSIGFANRLYHPNVDDLSGSVCLDVINQTWSPMFDLLNVFDHFIPQLLRYPNPSDPLNGEAAALLEKDPEAYRRKVREYVRQFASADLTLESAEDNQSDISDMSDIED